MLTVVALPALDGEYIAPAPQTGHQRNALSSRRAPSSGRLMEHATAPRQSLRSQ